MSKNSKKRMQPKQKATLSLVIFLVLCILCGYTAAFGVGKENKGRVGNIRLGLDLAGGVSITYEVVGDTPTDTEMQDTIYKLQKRVEGYSTEATVYKEGDDRIAVEIPGVSNANEILEELGQPGALTFTTEDGETVLTGSNIKSAEAQTTEENGIKNYVVALTMDDDGATKFAEATAAHLQESIITYDNEVVSSPVVQTTIENGECVIEGMESYEAAEQLASTIRIGALPLELKELRSNVVGAQLGQDAISTSIKAGAIGFVLICIFMIAVYALPGLCASIALVAYVILTLLALNGFNVTLTLPGIAGILLSIGMAVDANVIIFTRIKEEIRNGMSVQNAIANGFEKARSAILDGNITTLIAAIVLGVMGSGSVIGFAQTLGIGILLSIFTALYVTKLLVNACYHLGAKSEKLYGKLHEFKSWNYIKASKICIVISVVVIALGFIFMPINKANKSINNYLNFSLEFMGGTSVTLTMDDADEITDEFDQQVCDIVSDIAQTTSVQSQKVMDSNQLVVKTVELTVAQRDELQTKLEDEFEITAFSTENISASVSSEMRSDAVVAVIIATICMLIYIAFRFKDIRFGASAVIALLHDVLVVLTVYSVFRLSVGNTFIACMLTIVGYSINATIVIFDRIRENLREMNVKKDGLEAIVNTSISQTFTRTINTSLTTFVMVLVLYIMGVPSIKEFAFTLMAGVICGAYSSVCITGPIWFILKQRQKKKEQALAASKSKKKKK
ncbi:MAG: protein translocase subunit SecD [Lachnospiraceae bacterium]|nr:protein translocase subunit SecD [Lachnospiraceae bacterium]